MTLIEQNITQMQVATLCMNANAIWLQNRHSQWYLGQTGGGGVILYALV